MENILENAETAMNTIPSTFNEFEINRTVLWGRQINTEVQFDISVIIICKSGSHLHTQIFDNLLQCGFKSIVSVEPVSESFNIEEISRRYPSVKFIIPREKTSEGNLINAAVSEIDSNYFLVLRDSFNIPKGFMQKNLAENLLRDDVFCLVPRLIDKGGVSIVINFVPGAKKGKFVINPEPSVSDGLSTLYPFDYAGFYNREKFVQLGGYDSTIESSYWQNVDLSLRAWLWGEKIKITTCFQISYNREIPLEKSSPDLSYIRFYLKNILPKFRDDHGAVGKFAFIPFYLKSKCGIFEALNLFREALVWIKKNQFRFKKDVQYLIENWTAFRNEE